MSATKTLGTLIATALVGSITFLIATPMKVVKSKIKITKTNSENTVEEKDNLFI